MTKMIGELAGFDVKQDHVRVKLRVTAKFIGAAVGMLRYLGKVFQLRLIKADRGGVSIRAHIKDFRVDQDGYVRMTIIPDEEFDLGALKKMLDQNIVVEYKEASQE